MLSITLILATCTLGGMLFHGVVKSEANMPDPALSGEWRNGDVLSRQVSAVDHVHAHDYKSGELTAQADTLRQIVREGTGTGEGVAVAVRKSLGHATLLEELADRRRIERRLEIERLNHARDTKAVRAVYRVAGALA